MCHIIGKTAAIYINSGLCTKKGSSSRRSLSLQISGFNYAFDFRVKKMPEPISAAPPNPKRITSAPVLLPVEVVELELELLLDDELLEESLPVEAGAVPPVAGTSPLPLPVAPNAVPGITVIASSVAAIMAIMSRSTNLFIPESPPFREIKRR